MQSRFTASVISPVISSVCAARLARTCVGLLGASMLSISAAVKSAQAQTPLRVSSPSPGVICDRLGPLCYDRQGPSVRLTKLYFGQNAANRLKKQLRAKPTSNTVLLSNGALCDFRAGTCWSDGWSRQQVNTALTNHLFSLGGVGSNLWRHSQASKSQIRQAQCSITRWFLTLFRGNCELRESTNNLGRLLEVSLQDGSRYSIRRLPTGNFEIIDPQGKIWPLQVRNQGQTLRFNWSDRVLSVSDIGTTNNRLSLGELIDSLLGR